MNIIIGIFLFILGASIASFLGVVIYRVPNDMSIIKPNSFCPSCKKEIKWYDNIPILSYILLRGKCRYCHSKIGISSLLLELLGANLFLFTFLSYSLSYDLLFLLPIECILLVIAYIDYYNKIIYDWSWIILLILSCLYVLYLGLSNYEVPLDNLIGALVGFLSFLAISLIGKLIAKQDVLGMGDVILMGIAGLMLGYKVWLFALLVGSFVGSIVEVTLLKLEKRERGETIPFGPYLVLGILVGILIGRQVIDYFLGLVI